MEHQNEAILFEPKEFYNRAIIGQTQTRFIYSFEKLVDILMEQGLSYFEAVEEISFNMVRTDMDNWPEIQYESPPEN